MKVTRSQSVFALMKQAGETLYQVPLAVVPLDRFYQRHVTGQSQMDRCKVHLILRPCFVLNGICHRAPWIPSSFPFEVT